jgi:hypothetical protein
MPITYRKSAKGVAEIETRAHRLTPRLRSALILVDGRRNDVELKTLIPQQTEETLAALAEQGFIEIVATSAAAPAPPVRSAAPAPTAPAAASTPAPAANQAAPAAAPALDFNTARRDAVRQLSDLIGPASESLAIRMERARTAEELRPLLVLAAQSVANMRGRQAAATYAARFEGL